MNLNNIDLNKLRVFHSVVKNGGYQLAGDELGLTRSAISQSITTLESQIGVQLFQRKGKKLFPTEKALQLSNDFFTYQKSLHEALAKVKNQDDNVEGLIKIGSYYEFAKIWLTPRIKNFCDLYPNAQFKFIFDSPSKLQALLEKGSIDLSFSIFSHSGSNKIKSKKLLEQELVLAAPSQYSTKASSLESLLKLPIIDYYSSHTVLPRWIKTHFNKNRTKMSPKVYAASAEMMLEFIEQGIGVGVLPLYLLEARSSRNIKIIRPTNKKINDYIWLNQFTGQFENSAHKSFYNYIQSTF